MTFRRIEMLAKRNYDNPAERNAYRVGYNDGYSRRPRMAENEYPNAYSAGYWDGFADSEEPEK